MRPRRSPYNPRYVKESDSLSRPCDHPGCDRAGTYRAPRSPRELDRYYWFCLDHVRAYNQSWNYYAGMDAGEIESQIKHDTIWQRPTWPFGTNLGGFRAGTAEGFTRAYEAFTGEHQHRPRGEEDAEPAPEPHSPEAKAMATMELDAPITLDALKARYKALVKRYHPDANGGDRTAEHRLKAINEAYATLKKAVRA